MKKKIIVFLTTLLSVCMLMLGATACLDSGHVHAYDKAVATDEYLAQEATCETKATYYYSCSCGEKGTETFEHGESLGHSYGEAVANNDGTHTKTCSHDSLHVITEDCAGGTATCQAKAICEVCDTAYGNLAEHVADEWITTETEHYQTCVYGCDEKLNSGEHIFDENGECTECGYVKEEAPSIEITSDVFDITGDELYLKLSNSVESFNFADTIEVAEGVSFKIYQNDGTTQLTELTSALSEGDNVFYIIVTNGEEDKTYEVTIRRKPMYTVEFNANGGSSVTSQSVEEDSCAIEPTTTKDGYTFAGWDYDFATPITSNKTINASWNINEYTITFVLNNGEEDLVVTQEYNSDISAIENPTKVGYTFAGWDKEIPSKMPDEDLTITASWDINEYTITFVLNNGEEDLVVTQEYNSDISVIENPTKDGYTFAGWDKEIPSKMPAEDVTITAIWNVKQYSITFVLNNGEEDLVITQEHNSDISAIENPTREGYTFAGWDAEIPSKMPAENITINATWDINQYTLTINFNNGREDLVLTQDYNTDIQTIVDPEKVGYTFVGWDKEIPSKMPAKDVEVYALWQVNQYTLTIKLNNGEEDLVKTQDYRTDISAIEDPTREGYTFAGWDAEIPSKMPAQDLTINATWDINQYTITFVLNNGEEDVVLTQDYNSDIAIDNPQKVGYTFTGWDAEVPSKMPAQDLTINATWEINQYTLTFKYDNGHADLVLTQDYGTAIDAIEDPEKVAYTFAGWDREIPSTMPAESLTITAQWNVAPEMANFDFEYRYPSIIITGVKDKTVTDVVVPDYVTSIRAGVFVNCTNLKTLVIGNGVTSLPVGLLNGCRSLQSLTIPFVGDGEDAEWGRPYSTFGAIFGEEEYEGGEPTSFVTHDDIIYYIPRSLKHVEVTGGTLTRGAFYGCKYLETVILPDNLVKVGDSAFANCTSLTTVVMPSASIIGESAFENCVNLVNIDLPSNTTELSRYAFRACSSLREITISEGITVIPSLAFYDCVGLKSVTFNENLITIDSGAFANCRRLEWVVIPDKVTTIGSQAFNGCDTLISITIGESVTEIGATAFFFSSKMVEVYNKSSLVFEIGSEDHGAIGYYVDNIYTPTSGASKLSVDENGIVVYTDGEEKTFVAYTGTSTTLIMPNDITKMHQKALMYRDDLVNVTLSNNLREIGMDAFVGCSSLKQLIIPDSVTNLSTGVFRNCSSLQTLVIGTGVQYLYGSILEGCSSLQNLTIPFVGYERNSTNSTAMFGNMFGGKEYAGSMAVEQYWGESNSYTFYIPESLTNVTVTGGQIKYGAFYNCTNITKITLIGVTGIGEKAFYNCSSLKSIEIPSSITSIGARAFANCKNLTSLTLSDGIQAIADYAFVGCDGLKEVKYNGDIDSWVEIDFGTEANPLFNYSAGLYINGQLVTDVTINAETIGKNAFYNYKKLGNVTIGANVKSIGEGAFSMSGVKSVMFAEDYTCQSIGAYAFWGCEDLVSVEFADVSNNLTSIGDYAFQYCTNLISVELPYSLTAIGIQAFGECASLTDVEFGRLTGWKLKEKPTWSALISVDVGDITDRPAEILTTTYVNYYWVYEG